MFKVHSKLPFVRILFFSMAVGLVLCGCWKPQMVHPELYTSGRVLEQGRVEIAPEFFPGISVGIGLTNRVALHGRYGFTGDDIYGGGFQFVRELYGAGGFYVSGDFGIDWFTNSPGTFTGRRYQFGGTASWFSQSGKYGVHLPLHGYRMEYDWDRGWKESTSTEIPDQSASGEYLVAGIGLSAEGERMAIRFGVNGPSRGHLGRTELIGTFGLQLALRF